MQTAISFRLYRKIHAHYWFRRAREALVALVVLATWQSPAFAGIVTFNELFSHLGDDEAASVKEHYLPKFVGPLGSLNGVAITFERQFDGVLTLFGERKIQAFGPGGPNATCQGPFGNSVNCHELRETAKLTAHLGVSLITPSGIGVQSTNAPFIKTDCDKKRILTVPSGELRCTSTNARQASFEDTFNIAASDLGDFVSQGALDRLAFETSILLALRCGTGTLNQHATCVEYSTYTGKISVTYFFGDDENPNSPNPAPVPASFGLTGFTMGLVGLVAVRRYRRRKVSSCTCNNT